MSRHFFSALCVVFLLYGCSVTAPAVTQTKTERLTVLLSSLDSSIPKPEANRLALDILRETHSLTEEFELTSPPLFHNFLVNTGLRKKGLCYQWSDALYSYLSKGNYPSFSFHLYGANIGEYFSEHNTLVVTKKGEAQEEGIVIDPWRNSGELYFSTIKEDTVYHWIHRPQRGCD